MFRLTLQVLALLVLVYNATAQGTVDCQKRPPFNPRDAKNCCKIPEPNLQAYAGECSQHAKFLQKGANPCGLDCIFNTTQAIRNDDLIMENVRPILTKLYSDQIFVDSYMMGFEKCATTVKQKIEEFKASGRNPRQHANGMNQNCSPLPFVYAMCAHKNVFIDCPATAWTSSALCESAREYVKNCGPSPGKQSGGARGNPGLGNPVRRGGGGGGRRGGF